MELGKWAYLQSKLLSEKLINVDKRRRSEDRSKLFVTDIYGDCVILLVRVRKGNRQLNYPSLTRI